MIRIALVVAAMGLTSCGAISGSTGSIGSLGFGSLGGAPRAATTPDRANLPNLVSARNQISEMRSMAVNMSGAELTRTNTGVILRATGTPRGTGAYNLDLVLAGRQGSTLIFDLRGQITAAGAAVPRQVTVARAMTRAQLAGVRSIQIRAANGTRTLRR